jgi:hypothetical protein
MSIKHVYVVVGMDSVLNILYTIQIAHTTTYTFITLDRCHIQRRLLARDFYEVINDGTGNKVSCYNVSISIIMNAKISNMRCIFK